MKSKQNAAAAPPCLGGAVDFGLVESLGESWRGLSGRRGVVCVWGGGFFFKDKVTPKNATMTNFSEISSATPTRRSRRAVDDLGASPLRSYTGHDPLARDHEYVVHLTVEELSSFTARAPRDSPSALAVRSPNVTVRPVYTIFK